ncbi:MAG: holo-ACP synthase [Thermodesulfobacteriota bacterium]
MTIYHDDKYGPAVATGIDLVSIERMAKAAGSPRFLARVFTDRELSYAFSRSSPQRHLAGRFAAKEAFAKALGTGLGRVLSWKDVEVVRTGKGGEGGRPVIELHRAARGFAAGRRTHLSIAYSRGLAAAVVVIERMGPDAPARDK